MNNLVQEAIQVWFDGGWAMYLLAIDALILFAVGLNLWLYLRVRIGGGVAESRWKRWIESPHERRGHVGEVIDFVMGATSLDDLSVRFNELHTTEVAPIKRDLRFMKRAVSAAPLLGLLGTVTGMLTTFGALASGSGGEKTMGLVASGISEALITTETGLVIALPGLFFQFHLSRERERYEAFLVRLESRCSQYLFRVLKEKRARTGEAA
ncbi:MAG: MotA/TolQ/ExbB proton channel family protein [Acidobacteria bacterium]|nr:MotA/TolQ/ExbB proton channel family protein [Acidobacteriota bacterium]